MPSKSDLLQSLADAGVLVNGNYSASKYRFCDQRLKQAIHDYFPSFQARNFAELVYWLYHGLIEYPKTCSQCR